MSRSVGNVETFAQGSGAVSACEDKFVYQQVAQSVKQHETSRQTAILKTTLGYNFAVMLGDLVRSCLHFGP